MSIRWATINEDVLGEDGVVKARQGTICGVLYENPDGTARVLFGGVELDVLRGALVPAAAPDDHERVHPPVSTFVAIALRVGDTDQVLCGPSPSHADEEELPYVGLRVGETLKEAAARAAREHGMHDAIEMGEVIFDETNLGLVDLSERRVVVSASVAERLTRGDARFAALRTLARGRFAIAIRHVRSWLVEDESGVARANA